MAHITEPTQLLGRLPRPLAGIVVSYCLQPLPFQKITNFYVTRTTYVECFCCMTLLADIDYITFTGKDAICMECGEWILRIAKGNPIIKSFKAMIGYTCYYTLPQDDGELYGIEINCPITKLLADLAK